MKLKEAMKEAKRSRKPQQVTEPEPMSDVKVSVTIRLDLDVLNKIKAEGEKRAIPYQTLINSILKQHGDSTEALAKMIEKLKNLDVDQLMERVSHLEQSVELKHG